MAIRYGLWALLIYCSTILVAPWWAVALMIGLGLAALPRAQAATLAIATWVVGCTLGPPPWTLFQTFFFEPGYLQSMADQLPQLAGVLVAGAASQLRIPARWLGPVLLGLCILGYLLFSSLVNPRLAAGMATEPPDQGYFFDGAMLLKAHHLQRQGHPYYEANRLAFEKDQRNYEPGYPWQSLRPPYLFWAWSVLPDPSWIPTVARLLTALAMLVLYRATPGDPMLRLAAPVLLGSWSLFVVTNLFVMLADYWGCLLVLFGLGSQRLGWRRSGLILLFLAVLVREFTALALLGVTLTTRDRRGAALLLLAGLLYGVHEYYLRTVLGMHTGSTASVRMLGSVTNALATLRFGSVYLLGRDLLLPALALANLLHRDRVIQLMGLGMLALLIKLGNPGFTQFYALDFVPVLLWGAGLSLSESAPLESGAALVEVAGVEPASEKNHD